MKKGIVLLTAVGILMSMTVGVSAAEEIHTHKGDQEIVLTEAGETDLTKEELIEKAQDIMRSSENYAFIMNMDVEANMSVDAEGTKMDMDLIMKMNMTDNKNDGLEYRSENMTMSFFGMDMSQESEEYIFPNADGKKVSVKKETSSDTEEDDGGWIAEAVEEAEGEMEDLEADLEESTPADSMLTDELFDSFELLDRMYTDGEKNYYVLKGNAADVMGSGFEDIGEMFGDISSDAECYMLFAEDGMMESMYMDLSGLESNDMQEGMEATFSKFLISLYTDEASEIVIPEDVQAAGDAAE